MALLRTQYFSGLMVVFLGVVATAGSARAGKKECAEPMETITKSGGKTSKVLGLKQTLERKPVMSLGNSVFLNHDTLIDLQGGSSLSLVRTDGKVRVRQSYLSFNQGFHSTNGIQPVFGNEFVVPGKVLGGAYSPKGDSVFIASELDDGVNHKIYFHRVDVKNGKKIKYFEKNITDESLVPRFVNPVEETVIAAESVFNQVGVFANSSSTGMIQAYGRQGQLLAIRFWAPPLGPPDVTEILSDRIYPQKFGSSFVIVEPTSMPGSRKIGLGIWDLNGPLAKAKFLELNTPRGVSEIDPIGFDSFAVTADGGTLYGTVGAKLGIWDAGSGRLKRSLPLNRAWLGDFGNFVKLSDDGTIFIQKGGGIRVASLVGRAEKEIFNVTRSDLWMAEVSPNGRFLFTGHFAPMFGQRRAFVAVYDLKNLTKQEFLYDMMFPYPPNPEHHTNIRPIVSPIRAFVQNDGTVFMTLVRPPRAVADSRTLVWTPEFKQPISP